MTGETGSMVRLKYIGGQDVHCPDNRHTLEQGREYEVAEIYEFPGHIMIREPGSFAWPSPGDPLFGWHLDTFESPTKPLPIIARGYNYFDWSEYFGVLIDDPKEVQLLIELQNLEDKLIDKLGDDFWPSEYDSFDSWWPNVKDMFPEPIAITYFDLEHSRCGSPSVSIQDEVFLANLKLRNPFAIVAYSAYELVQSNTPNDQACDWINRFLKMFSIEPRQSALLNLRCWYNPVYPRIISDETPEEYPPGTSVPPVCDEPKESPGQNSPQIDTNGIMSLRYTGGFQAHCMNNDHPLILGRQYEVAEIYENPEHIMIREPGSSEWPDPRSNLFGWEPNTFETIEEPIPIIARGYAYSDWSDYYGVIIDNPEVVERIRQIINESRSRAMDNEHLLLHIPEDIFLSSRENNNPFAIVAYAVVDRVRYDISSKEADEAIRTFLESVQDNPQQPGLLDLAYWHNLQYPRMCPNGTPVPPPAFQKNEGTCYSEQGHPTLML